MGSSAPSPRIDETAGSSPSLSLDARADGIGSHPPLGCVGLLGGTAQPDPRRQQFVAVGVALRQRAGFARRRPCRQLGRMGGDQPKLLGEDGSGMTVMITGLHPFPSLDSVWFVESGWDGGGPAGWMGGLAC